MYVHTLVYRQEQIMRSILFLDFIWGISQSGPKKDHICTVAHVVQVLYNSISSAPLSSPPVWGSVV